MLSQTIAYICMTHLFFFSCILFFKKSNQKANRILAVIMFCFGYVHINHIVIISGIISDYSWTHWIAVACFPLIFLIGPFYLYYSSIMTGTTIQWRKKIWLHLLPFTAPVLYVASFFFKSEAEIVAYYEATAKVQPLDANIVLAVATAQGVTYWIWSVIIVRQYNSKIKFKPFYKELNLEWLSWITICLILLSVIIIPVSLYLIQSDITILYTIYPVIPTTIYIALLYKSLNFPSTKQEKELLMETERKKISKDLHDELGGGLSKLSVISQKIEHFDMDSEELKKYGKSMRETSRQLAENMNTLMWSLNTENQCTDVFVAKLKKIFYSFLDSFDVKHGFIVTGNTENNYVMNIHVLKNLYPAIKEALHNSVKHASSDNIDLILNFHDNLADIIIKDNGTGFDLLKVQKRGLNNIEQRINNFGGIIEIITEKERGTEIRLKNIPLEKV